MVAGCESDCMITVTNPTTSRYSIHVPSDEISDWDAYINLHSKGSVFHTAGMESSLRATPKHTPYFIAARDNSKPNNPIVAMLASCRVDTFSERLSRFASRSIWFAEPICDADQSGADALKVLVDRHDRHVGRKVLFSEIRPLQSDGIERDVLVDASFEPYDYLNYVVDLSVGEEALWKGLSKNCRKQVKKCEARGVTLDKVSAGPEAVRQMYQCVSLSYQRSGIPLAGVELFLAAIREFDSEQIDIRLARFEGKIVASGITLKYGDRVFAWYGGAERVTGLSPFSLLTWDEIKSGSREGFRFYDFGGAGVPERPYGPREFKSKFGGELVNFGRYRKANSKIVFAAAESAFRILKQKRLFKSKAT